MSPRTHHRAPVDSAQPKPVIRKIDRCIQGGLRGWLALGSGVQRMSDAFSRAYHQGDPALRGRRRIAGRARGRWRTRKMDIRKAMAAMFGAVLMAVPGLGFAQEAQVYKGMIVSHADNSLVVRMGADEQTLALTSDTKITATAGAGVLQRESGSTEDLIRGLAIEFRGLPSADGLVAQSITFKKSDLKTARQISAGRSGQGVLRNGQRHDFRPGPAGPAGHRRQGQGDQKRLSAGRGRSR